LEMEMRGIPIVFFNNRYISVNTLGSVAADSRSIQ
jgi:hypothetical protein